MKDQELIGLWKHQESKIDQLMSMNMQLLREQSNTKMRKSLFGIKVEKVTGIVIGFLFVFILGFILATGLKATSFQLGFFTVSIGVIFIVNIKVLADYIKHLVLLNRINFDGSVAEIQKQLIELKLSMIKSMRIVVIQIPFYTTFYLSSSWFPSQTPPELIIIQLIITGIFTFAAAWIFFNFKPENFHKKWVKWLISSTGATQIEKSLAQLEDIEELKNN